MSSMTTRANSILSIAISNAARMKSIEASAKAATTISQREFKGLDKKLEEFVS